MDFKELITSIENTRKEISSNYAQAVQENKLDAVRLKGKLEAFDEVLSILVDLGTGLNENTNELDNLINYYKSQNNVKMANLFDSIKEIICTFTLDSFWEDPNSIRQMYYLDSEPNNVKPLGYNHVKKIGCLPFLSWLGDVLIKDSLVKQLTFIKDDAIIKTCVKAKTYFYMFKYNILTSTITYFPDELFGFDLIRDKYSTPYSYMCKPHQYYGQYDIEDKNSAIQLIEQLENKTIGQVSEEFSAVCVT